jgi:hypothetical protein
MSDAHRSGPRSSGRTAAAAKPRGPRGLSGGGEMVVTHGSIDQLVQALWGDAALYPPARRSR